MSRFTRSLILAPMFLIASIIFGIVKEGLSKSLVRGLLENGFSWPAFAFGAALLVIAWAYWSLLRRGVATGASAFAKDGEMVLTKDLRRPILYLRSFRDDEQEDVFQSIEWTLKRLVSATGPMIAIGDPAENLQTPGAARIYIDDEWRDRVSKLVVESQAIVIRIGVTAGVRWELAEARRIAIHNKVFIFIPLGDAKLRRKLWTAFREAEEFVSVKLPETLSDDTTFMYFDESWTAIPLFGEQPSRVLMLLGNIGYATVHPNYYLPLLVKPASLIFQSPRIFGGKMQKTVPVWAYVTLAGAIVGVTMLCVFAVGFIRMDKRDFFRRGEPKLTLKIERNIYEVGLGETRQSIAGKFNTSASFVQLVDQTTGEVVAETDERSRLPLKPGDKVEVRRWHFVVP